MNLACLGPPRKSAIPASVRLEGEESSLRFEPAMDTGPRHIAFDLFYAENAVPAYRFALRLTGNREDAEDLAAQALAKAWRAESGFRRDASPRTWLFKIILNEWKMACRRGKVTVTSLEAAHEAAASLAAPDFDLAQAICELPDSLKHAFLLVKGEGLSHKEAGAILAAPEGTVSFWVHQAVRRLRSALTAGEVQAMELSEVQEELEENAG